MYYSLHIVYAHPVLSYPTCSLRKHYASWSHPGFCLQQRLIAIPHNTCCLPECHVGLLHQGFCLCHPNPPSALRMAYEKEAICFANNETQGRPTSEYGASSHWRLSLHETECIEDQLSWTLSNATFQMQPLVAQPANLPGCCLISQTPSIDKNIHLVPRLVPSFVHFNFFSLVSLLWIMKFEVIVLPTAGTLLPQQIDWKEHCTMSIHSRQLLDFMFGYLQNTLLGQCTTCASLSENALIKKAFLQCLVVKGRLAVLTLVRAQAFQQAASC